MVLIVYTGGLGTGAALTLAAAIGKTILIAGAISIVGQMMTDLSNGSVSDVSAYEKAAIIGSTVGLVCHLTGSVPGFMNNFLVTVGTAFVSGSAISAISQYGTTGTVDLGKMIMDGGYSAVVAAITFGVMKGIQALRAEGVIAGNNAGSIVDDIAGGAENVSPNVRGAFGSDAKVTTLTQDTTVYRYYGEGSEASGSWFTPNQVANPISELALPPGNTAQFMDTVVLPAGTRVFEGTVAPNFGQLGGGYQYYVLP